MGKIKSALELAMEKTADLKSDKAALRRSEVTREGKVCLSRYLESPDKSDLASSLMALEGEELAWFKAGALDTVLANLSLPRVEADLERLGVLNGVLAVLAGEGAEAVHGIFDQLHQLLAQYLENLEQLDLSLRQQYEPQLRQKEMLLRQQTGQEFHLTPEQDPEFTKLLSEQLSRMDEQYSEVLKQAKEQIRLEVL